jgi:hypothetical protein
LSYEGNNNTTNDDDDDDGTNDDDDSQQYGNAPRRNNNLTYHPLNICVNLDEKKAVASVWLLCRIGRSASTSSLQSSSSSPSSVEYEETVTVLHWWRRGKVWECFRQSGTKVVGS